MDKSELVELILQFRKERNWKQFHSSKNLAISLMLESSEVVELFQWTKDHKLPSDKKEDLSNELADVYYWLLLLAYDEGVDLEKALEKKMKLNAKKYPVKKAKGVATKYTKL
ncbi:MAG: nucleotide pyrophosphohydrolase [Candidatus Levybacteria bacterium]|nr:nucleotide pyrophosphohydrolase [Candidatus Levybacteria bacterium]